MSEEKSSPIKIIAIVFVVAVFVGCESNNYPETVNKNEQPAAKPTEPAKPEALVFDPNRADHRIIEADMRIKLGKPGGKLTAEDMAKLKRLGGGYRGVSDISPMKAAVNVETILIDRNQISDLSPLSGLKKLKYLDATKNRISDLSPLAGLSELRELILHANQITDLTPLAGLSNLQRLRLIGNQITDLTPLTKLNQLTTLDLSSNPKLTRAQIDELQKALPNCKITHNAKD